MKSRKEEIAVSLAISLTALFIFLNGCATMPREADMKETLKGAAEKYWKLRMEDKYEEAYRLEDSEGLPPFEDYRNRAGRIKKISMVSHSIGEVTTEGNKGKVRVRFRFVAPNVQKPLTDFILDEWVFKGGEWLHKFPLN